MRTRIFSVIAGILLISASVGRADVREGLVSYWPLDTVTAEWTTPDLAFGNDLTLHFMDESNLVEGRRGQAMSFDGESQYLYLIHSGDRAEHGLPVSTAGGFTVSLWVKGDGSVQQDRRVFSEGSTINNTPLFNIGTDSAGAETRTGVVDIYIRNNAGTAVVGHRKSVGLGFDDEWRHLAWVAENGTARLYIDGVLDPTDFNYTPGAFTLDTLSIGAVLRAADSFHFAGLIDDVAIWERALSEAEVGEVMNDGIQTPVPAFAPTFTNHPSDVTRPLGDRVTLTGSAYGARPLSFQWRRDGQIIPGATGESLSLIGLSLADSGSYTLEATNSEGTTTSQAAVLTVQADPEPDITRGLVSYWPFDTANGTTPDLVSRNDMVLVDMDASYLFEGRFGQALWFDGFGYVRREGGFPIYNNEAYTITMWVNAFGVGQTDLRIFSEGSSTDASPLFNLGTDNTGATDSLNVFIRNDSGGGVPVNHRKSTQPVFDGEWRHIAWVDVNGQAKLYVDGVLDETDFSYTQGNLTLNRTSVGAILRAEPSHFFSGTIDEVALWNRALTVTEIEEVMTAGVRAPDAAVAPEITVQPRGADVWAGGGVVLTVQATGTGPLSFQWHRNDEPLTGANESTLVLNNAQPNQAGVYTVVVSNEVGSATSQPAEVRVTAITDITSGLVAHWPFETISGNTTPDVVGGHDMTLHNMDEGNQVAGRFGQALSFDGETQYLSRVQDEPNPELPIYQHGAYTVSLWVRGIGTGQNDRRVFSEGSTVSANPLLNIGTHNAGEGDEVNIYLRNDTGAVHINHVRTVQDGIDGEWRHIVWVDDNGMAAVYVDGVRDETNFNYTRGVLSLNTTTIGAILRASPSHYFAGEIDEVALWRRALTDEEIVHLTQNGLVPQAPALRIAEMGLAGGNIRLEVESAHPDREHLVQQTSGLAPADWSDIPGVEFTASGDNRLRAEFPVPAEGARFYRVVNVPPAPIFADDFETEAHVWTHGGTGDSWERGTPTTGPGTAFSGENVWATGLHTSYGVDTRQWLRSPAINLEGLASVTLSFWEFRDVEPLFQGVALDYTTVSIKDAADPEGAPLAVLAENTGSQTRWTQRTFNLPPEVLGKNVIVEFLLVSDSFEPTPQAGWYIDDVLMTGQ